MILKKMLPFITQGFLKLFGITRFLDIIQGKKNSSANQKWQRNKEKIKS
jgi:hypothetical protein